MPGKGAPWKGGESTLYDKGHRHYLIRCVCGVVMYDCGCDVAVRLPSGPTDYTKKILTISRPCAHKKVRTPEDYKQ